MVTQKLDFITRKARFWPEIPRDTVKLPVLPAAPNPPDRVTLITLSIGLGGIILSGLLFTLFSRGAGSFILIFVAMSAIAAISGGIGYLAQKRKARRQTSYLRQTFSKRLEETQKQACFLQQKERQAYLDLDPPFMLPAVTSPWYDSLRVTPLVERDLNESDLGLWARRPQDQDFLAVRIGLGRRAASFQMQGEERPPTVTLPSVFDEDIAAARALQAHYATLLAPMTVKLGEQGVVALVSDTTPRGLEKARELSRVLVAHIAYHHSPEEVRIVILAPEGQGAQWQWSALLPHTHEPNQPEGMMGSSGQAARCTLAIGPEEIIEQLPLISRELSRRELLAADERRSNTQLLPHLIFVIDHFDAQNDLDPPPLALPVGVMTTFGQASPASGAVGHRQLLREVPLKRAEMTLALTRAAHLGVSVVCVCAQKSDVPVSAAMVIEITVPPVAPFPERSQHGGELQAQQGALPLYAADPATPVRGLSHYSMTNYQANARFLRPNPPSVMTCELLDAGPVAELQRFASRMQHLRPAITKRPQLRSQVDLRALFEPAIDLAIYSPMTLWSDARLRMKGGGSRSIEAVLRVPIGLKMGDEVQYLDFLKDGPHGLLIGQTGSGKSELLQTIIMATAMIYRPEEVTFLLIDYKAGLALEPFRSLPHTIGFLSNVSSPALIARFITMLRAEAVRREVREAHGQATPRLIIIIDEFAEMAKRTETVLDELFTITRVGRQLGMHLLLAAQRPEGIIGNKVRDYVQYRLCLRAASNEDSREVIGRVDAANLPASIPGRGFLLHGDNQLDLFQAARTTLPI